MKSFFKWFLAALGLLLLVTLALLATVGWWLPPLAESQARSALEALGFEAVELKVERMGYSGVTVTGLALEREGAELALRSVNLDYTVTGLLFRQQADGLLIEGLDVTFYLRELLDGWQLGGESLEEDTDEPFELGELSLPVKSFLVDDSYLTLEADGWRKRLELTAFLQEGSPARYLFDAGDEHDTLSLSGKVDLRTLKNESSFQLRSADPATWQRLIQNLDLVPLPEDLRWQSGPLELEGALRSEGNALGPWTVMASLNGLQAEQSAMNVSLGQFNFGASGEGLAPEKVWAGLFEGKLSLPSPWPIRFSWDAATLETLGPERSYFKLEGWRLTGDLAELKLGDISASAGPLRVLLDGPWASIRSQADLQAFTIRAIMTETPLELYTGKGSIFGLLGLRTTLYPLDRSPNTEAVISLKEAEINSGPVSVTSDAIEVKVSGQTPDALSASINLTNVGTSWVEGNGKLEGLNGQIRIANLMPLAMPEKQTLSFERVQQGNIVIHNGEVTLSYRPESEEGPMELSLTAGGAFAGGGIAGRITVTLGEPWSAQADLLLQHVDLAQLAGLLPKFEGKIQGFVSGELPIKVVGNRVIIQPGYLEMAAGETGKFSYTRQGWLTQDPSLNPEKYAKDKQLVELMKEPNGGAILTELALRDLNLTAFRLDILKPGEGDRRIIIHLEGDGKFKDVKVPIVQDIRIGGDVKETINLILKANEKLEFGK